MARAHALHFPPHLAAELIARTPPGDWPEVVIQAALERFSCLTRSLRETWVKDYWWQASRLGAWRKLRITETTWQRGRACKTTCWTVEQVIVAACAYHCRGISA